MIPRLDRARWSVLSPHLDHALDLPATERPAWLEGLRAGDPVLAGELEALLEEYDRVAATDFLQHSPAPRATLAGLALGDYTLRAQIGHGGMGSVWLAERSDGRYQGLAAVKLLNASLIGQDGEGRFRREGSILARLRHRHIAQLLDAGVSPAGQPFLVLEHVDGENLDVYCDRRRLGVEARVALFLDVLAAVAHAHASLIVHRDLKPSNVLVDREGTVKLLDFGVAKLLAPDAAGPALTLTRAGAAALTPAYAAPEQLMGGDITTATDVYALGVLLYELLSGRHPVGADPQAPPSDIVRAVVEREPPRLSSTDTAAAPERVRETARTRGLTSEGLRRALRGDLETIVGKALKKDPAQRYASVGALADDLRRFLDGRPVQARPDTAAYRLRKFVGRHRGGVAVGVVLASLLAWNVVRERTLRARAEAEAHKARAVEEYLVSVFDVADPFAPPTQGGGDTTARALLDRGAARVETALSGQPEVQAELSGVLGRIYDNLGLSDAAGPLLRKALEQRRAAYGPRHPAVAEAMDQLGLVLTRQNRYPEAEPLLREALAQRRAFLGDRNEATALSLDHLATLLQYRDDLDAAEPLYREALAVRRAVHGPGHEKVADSLNNLALLLHAKGRTAEAEPLLREAMAIAARELGEDHPSTATTVNNLALVLARAGRLDEAEALYRRALAALRKRLGNTHPHVTAGLNNLGTMLARKGALQEAEPLVREALALDLQMFGENHDHTADSLRNLADILRRKGDFDEAERTARRALAVNRSLFGAEHTQVASSLHSLALALQMKGDLEHALPLFRESRAQYGRLMGETHRNFKTVSVGMARAVLESGDAREAEALTRFLSGAEAPPGTPPATVIEGRVVRARALVRLGRGAEAMPGAEAALQSGREQFRPEDWRLAEARLALGEALTASGQHARAEPVLREACATLARQRRSQPRLAREADAALEGTRRPGGRPAERR